MKHKAPKKTCAGCFLCCTYVTIEIDDPKTVEDIDALFWYIDHGLTVFIDHENDWLVEVRRKCDYLTPEGLCKIYEDRPIVCRDHEPDDCEKHGEGDVHKHLFANRKMLCDFLKKKEKYWKIIETSDILKGIVEKFGS